MESSGLSATTIWRFRQRGWLKTTNMAGRQYIARRDLVEFNRRMAAGEFSKEPTITANAAAAKEVKP